MALRVKSACSSGFSCICHYKCTECINHLVRVYIPQAQQKKLYADINEVKVRYSGLEIVLRSNVCVTNLNLPGQKHMHS